MIVGDRDPVAVMVAWLLARPEIDALVGERVYGAASSPPPGYTPGSAAALCLMVRGGRDDYSDAVKVVSMQFLCYGGGASRAEQVYSANGLAGALHGLLQGTHTPTFYARREQVPVTLEEPSTEWPYALTFYQISFNQMGV